MNEPEKNILRASATSVAWSVDVISFLRGATSDSELDIHDAADALRMTLSVWIAGSASNDSLLHLSDSDALVASTAVLRMQERRLRMFIGEADGMAASDRGCVKSPPPLA